MLFSKNNNKIKHNIAKYNLHDNQKYKNNSLIKIL